MAPSTVTLKGLLDPDLVSEYNSTAPNDNVSRVGFMNIQILRDLKKLLPAAAPPPVGSTALPAVTEPPASTAPTVTETVTKTS
jgi:hypothetical protein